MSPLLIGKVALVTDCSSVFGNAITQKLSENGVKVIGLVKNETDLKKYYFDEKKNREQLIISQCDLTDSNDLLKVLKDIIKMHKHIDILINCYQSDQDCQLNDGALDDIKTVIDININSLVACTRHVAGFMIEEHINGHIINLNAVPSKSPDDSSKNMAIATKSVMISLNEILRHEFRYLKANIKTTNITCGVITKLNANEICNLIVSILDTPQNLMIHEISID